METCSCGREGCGTGPTTRGELRLQGGRFDRPWLVSCGTSDDKPFLSGLDGALSVCSELQGHADRSWLLLSTACLEGSRKEGGRVAERTNRGPRSWGISRGTRAIYVQVGRHGEVVVEAVIATAAASQP